MKRIILNWMPPALEGLASPSLSVLKNYLAHNGFDVKIYYWNLLLAQLQSDFVGQLKADGGAELSALLLYHNYLAVKFKDKGAKNRIKSSLIAIKPQYLSEPVFRLEDHMTMYAEKLDKILDEILNEIDCEESLMFGMSMSLYQWIPASIIACKIKDNNPDSIVVAGGIGTRKTAKAFLDNFKQFDFAIWGEGEEAIVALADMIHSGHSDYSSIPSLVFRENGVIKSSTVAKKYMDMSSPDISPNFDDYFECLNKLVPGRTPINPVLPVETSRGCHWRQCHFCYLNDGYKYRRKDVSSTVREILHNIEVYNVKKFQFLDNDIVGTDPEKFNDLLDGLIKIKETYPDFVIINGEIISKGLNSDILKKMSLAGFESIQIGYESPSNELLRKIDKKNTFASNLLAIKFAAIYNIRIAGANIIMGLLEETEDDIIEAIENLHCLRFYLQRDGFKHNYSFLGIMHSSRYYKDIGNKIYSLNTDDIMKLLPSSYIRDEDYFLCFSDVTFMNTNNMWADFENVEKHYLNNRYTYKLYSKGSDEVIYREYYNGRVVNELGFETGSIEWLILTLANDAPITINALTDSIRNQYRHNPLDTEIIDMIEGLKEEKLIYCNSDYSEIITLFNTKQIF